MMKMCFRVNSSVGRTGQPPKAYFVMAAALLIFVPPLQQFRRTKDRNNTGSSLNAACKLDFLSCTLEGWLFFGPKPPLSPSESNDEARTSPGVSRPAFRIESMSDGTRDDNIV